MTEAAALFAGLPARDRDRLDGVRAAVLGVAHGSPYKAAPVSHAAGAAGAIRAASMRFARQRDQFDWDLGRVFSLDGQADCGDVPTAPDDAGGNRARITAAVRSLRRQGVAPLVLGGDDSVPIPVLAGFEADAPLTILQIDAHADWGDEITGNRFGYGSPMRRASEMAHVRGMVQVGMRGLGSGNAGQLDDARAWGSHLIPARTLHRDGMASVLDLLPPDGAVFCNIDCDGLDPSVLPAVNMPTPGGLLYQDVLDLLHGAATRSRLVGCAIVELVPQADRDGLSALVAARLAAVALNLMAHRCE